MFQTFQTIYTETSSVLTDFIDLSWKILPFVVMVLVIVHVYQAIRNNKGDYGHIIVRIGLVGLALFSYRWWSVEIATLIIEIAKIFKTDGISNYHTTIIELFKNHAENEARWFEVGLQFRGFLFYSVLWMSVGIVALATVFFEMLQFWAQAFLWILGPLAIVLNLFPNFKGAFVRWLNRFIAVSFWSVIYMVATRIFNELIGTTFEGLWNTNRTGLDIGGQGFAIMQLIVLSIAFFFTIVRIPAMTSWLTEQSFNEISALIATGATYGQNKIMAISKTAGSGAGQLGKVKLQALGSLIKKLKG